MAYRCEFTAEGRPIPAYLELQESHANVLRPYARRGEIALGGEVVQVRSVHDIVGGKLPTGAPIGYVFEQDGREVGAVDVRDEGRRRLYRVNGLALKPIHDWVRGYEAAWDERFGELDVVLDDLKRQEQDEGDDDE